MVDKDRALVELEQMVLISSVQYAQAKGIPFSKVAWALSTLVGRPDNVVYHQLCEMKDYLAQAVAGVDVTRMSDYQNVLHQLRDQVVLDQEVGSEEEQLENRIGEVVKVRVLSVRTYGAVCSVLGTTRTLLLHLSEVADEFIDDLSKFMTVGDEFYAMLIVNPKNQLGLSTRRIGSLEG